MAINDLTIDSVTLQTGTVANSPSGGTDIVNKDYADSLPGAVGPQGVNGSDGFQGVNGSNGFQGTAGSTGSAGVQGKTGVQGFNGPQGVNGSTGSTGSAGVQGATGVQGVGGTIAGASGITVSQVNGASISTSYTAIGMNQQAVVGSDLSHVGGTDTKITCNTSGWYLITYAGVSEADLRLTSKVRANGTTDLPGSDCLGGFESTTKPIEKSFIAQLNATDYIELMVLCSSGTDNVLNVHMTVTRMAVGPQGVSGSNGSNGVQGVNGSTGVQGVQGPSGSTTTVTAYNTTTNGTQTQLFTDGSSAQITMPINTCWAFSATVSARKTDGSDYAAFFIRGAINQVAVASTTSMPGAGVIIDNIYPVSNNWSVTCAADTSAGALKILVTGAASTTINWLATVQITAVS